ncbi:DKNYY domain-containing protein [Segatella bryantii]|uniref:DKNYY domain-containing protein n=1 Tax=Segatella bryantii TaxID=77095 RepID=UPI00241D2076|nr:DKNYY domain-containing protein [Segatella bryantii]
MQQDYNDSNIRTLSGLEHIRHRPGMYIGTLGDGSSIDDGIYILLKEVMDNSIDEFKMNAGSRIEVNVEDGKRISVRDYGRGIPQGKLIECVSEPKTSAKFESDKTKKVFKNSIGMNGVGIKAVTALSSRFVVSSYRDGKVRTAVFERGILKNDVTEPTDEENGTFIFFEPDDTKFLNYHFHDDNLESMMQMYSYVNVGLTIKLNEKQFVSHRGLEDLFQDRMTSDALYPIIHIKGSDIDIAFTHTCQDPSTFKVLNEHYATDMHHVWFNDNIIEGAEPTTFVIPNGGISNLAHDAHDYYMGNQPLHVADMGSFRQIDENWALDSLYVYYLDVDVLADKKAVSVGDSRTFKALNGFYAVDAKCVYYKNNIVKGADPASFAVLKGQYRYGQDRHRVYYEAYGSKIRNFNALRHKNMEDGIYNAFHTDGKTVYNPELMAMPVGTDFLTIHKVELFRNWYADSKHVYYENRLLPGANPKTFVIFPSHYVNADYVSDNNKNADYSHDDSHVYYRDSLMSDVDIASFVCGYDFVVEKSFAFDKSRYYEGTPNPRIEKLRQGKYQVVK